MRNTHYISGVHIFKRMLRKGECSKENRMIHELEKMRDLNNAICLLHQKAVQCLSAFTEEVLAPKGPKGLFYLAQKGIRHNDWKLKTEYLQLKILHIFNSEEY